MKGEAGDISENSRNCEFMRGTDRGTTYHQGVRWLDNISETGSAYSHENKPQSSPRWEKQTTCSLSLSVDIPALAKGFEMTSAQPSQVTSCHLQFADKAGKRLCKDPQQINMPLQTAQDKINYSTNYAEKTEESSGGKNG